MALRRHLFPGNIRELQNALEHAVRLAEIDTLRVDDLPESINRAAGTPALPGLESFESAGSPSSLGETPMFRAVETSVPKSTSAQPFDGEGFCLAEHLERHERHLILSAFERTSGTRTEAATLLGIGYRSLRHRLGKLRLD